LYGTNGEIDMTDVYICDGIRTPVGRYGGGLAPVRTDDLAAITIMALMERNPDVDWAALDDVWLGCSNQAGEDNRNVARMSSLLAGLPQEVPACTVNRLCGSGLNAVGGAAADVAFALRDWQGRGGLRADTTDVRHHHGVAVYQPESA
jgi:acetyl-CoA acetyltransferase